MRNHIKLIGLVALVSLAAAGEVTAAPVIQPQFQAGASQPFLYQPGPTAAFSQPAPSLGSRYQGPVTGYGAGSMARPPGAPPNPPYFRGNGGR